MSSNCARTAKYLYLLYRVLRSESEVSDRYDTLEDGNELALALTLASLTVLPTCHEWRPMIGTLCCCPPTPADNQIVPSEYSSRRHPPPAGVQWGNEECACVPLAFLLLSVHSQMQPKDSIDDKGE